MRLACVRNPCPGDNIDVDLVSLQNGVPPECTISFTYAQKFALLELFPIFVFGLLLLGMAVSTGAELMKTKRACCSILANMGDVLVGGTAFEMRA